MEVLWWKHIQDTVDFVMKEENNDMPGRLGKASWPTEFLSCLWVSVEETGVRKKRARRDWLFVDAPLRQPFLFQDSKILLYQLAKCHHLKFPRYCHTSCAPGCPHEAPTKGLTSCASGAFQDSVWVWWQSSTRSNRYAPVTQFIGYSEHGSQEGGAYQAEATSWGRCDTCRELPAVSEWKKGVEVTADDTNPDFILSAMETPWVSVNREWHQSWFQEVHSCRRTDGGFGKAKQKGGDGS